MPHFHSSPEFVFAEKGNIFLTVNGSDCVVREGQCALILSYQLHSLQGSRDSVTHVAVFSKELVPLFAAAVKDRQGSTPVFTCSDNVKKIICNELIGKSAPSVLMKKACLYAVCDEYLHSVKLVAKRSTDSKIFNILGYVALNFRDDISLKALASLLGYEYYYLSRLLGEYNINLRQFLNVYRVENAKKLLKEGKTSVTEAAMNSGFRSIRSFNYVFMAFSGKSPSDYLRNISHRQ